MISRFLFPRYADERLFSFFLLILRVVVGVMFMMHGFDKLINMTVYSDNFLDPLYMGPQWSLVAAMFAELFCSAAFVLGLLYRLSMIPMILVMLVAFFGVHGGSMAEGELAFVYLVVFLIMYAAGPGRYSLDYMIWKALASDKKK
ncbi:MAG: DoxX family protein [Mediterranea massiliensis]|nr:DoxX family protein [Mediterranea massiliensis]